MQCFFWIVPEKDQKMPALDFYCPIKYNGHMLDDEKDTHQYLKDSKNTEDLSVKDRVPHMPYLKANKLVTALFMVTDIIDKDEPIRAKLRSLGMDIISDMYISSIQVQQKISQIISFLDITSTIGMISEMNATVLRKGFSALNQSINEATLAGDSNWLDKFVNTNVRNKGNFEITEMEMVEQYKGPSTRIGVQKGGTLLKALSNVNLSDKTYGVNSASMSVNNNSTKSTHKDQKDNFDLLKKQRREEVLKVIKATKSTQANGGATITDIKNKAKEFSASLGITALLGCSEKTLQRELVSMVKDNVLQKSGEKRWSKYFI